MLLAVMAVLSACSTCDPKEQLYVLGSGTLREDILTITFLKSMKQASSTDGVCFHLRGKQKFDVKQKTMKQSNGLFQNLTQDLRFFSQPCLSNYMENGELPLATLTLLFENLTIITK